MGAYAPIYHMLHEQTVPWCPVKCKCPRCFPASILYRAIIDPPAKNHFNAGGQLVAHFYVLTWFMTHMRTKGIMCNGCCAQEMTSGNDHV